MSNFRQAFKLAQRAHFGQKDKAGKDYILHPLHVALQFKGDEKRMIVAILHDVVEDSDITFDDLRQAGFSEEVVAAVDALTKRPGETYHEALCRAAQNPLALDVKIADMTHNSDLSRLGRPANDNDMARVGKYSHYIGELRNRKKTGAQYGLRVYNG